MDLNWARARASARGDIPIKASAEEMEDIRWVIRGEVSSGEIENIIKNAEKSFEK